MSLIKELGEKAMKELQKNNGLKIERKKGKWKESIKKYWFLILLGFVFGAFTGIFLTEYLEKVFHNNTKHIIGGLYGTLILFFIFFFFHIIIHETGHLIFGLLTGYSFVSFRVGSLTLIRENGGLKRKKYSIPGTAGQCLMAPPRMINGKFPYKLYNYGGAMLNLITSLFAILFILIFPELPVILTICLGSYGAGGILLGITNAIPMKSMGVANDGFNVKCMKKDSIARSSFYLQLDINARQSDGMRLKDMPPEWFLLPEGADLSNVLIAFVKLIEYYRYLDLMDFEAAGNCLRSLEPVMDLLPSGYKNIFNLERLFLNLINQGNITRAEEYLTKEVKILIKTGKNDLSIKRIAYTYQARFARDDKAAKKCLQEAQSLVSRYPVSAEADSQMMLITYVEKMTANKLE